MPCMTLLDLAPAEIRLLLACARCGPVPAPVARTYFAVSRRRLDTLVDANLMVLAGMLVVPACLRRAFRGAPLPTTVPCFTASTKALRALVRRRTISGWIRVHALVPTPHLCRLLAIFLAAPPAVRRSWQSEREVLDQWFADEGLWGKDRLRARRPRLPDAAFVEGGLTVALEIHNERRGPVERHPDILAKRAAIVGPPSPGVPTHRGRFNELRVVTIRGTVYRCFPDGSISEVVPVPCPEGPPDGVYPFSGSWEGDPFELLDDPLDRDW